MVTKNQKNTNMKKLLLSIGFIAGFASQSANASNNEQESLVWKLRNENEDMIYKIDRMHLLQNFAEDSPIKINLDKNSKDLEELCRPWREKVKVYQANCAAASPETLKVLYAEIHQKKEQFNTAYIPLLQQKNELYKEIIAQTHSESVSERIQKLLGT